MSQVDMARPALARPELSPLNFAFLQKHVKETTGIVLDPGKEYLLEARLGPLLSEMRLNTVDQLCQTLTRDPLGAANRRLIDAVTTNETLFFRDFATFEALRKEVVPMLLKKVATGQKLRIWSAAASSGQEAYSLAMLLHELNVPASQVEIYATDISDEILAKARAGKYVQFEVNRGLPSAYLTKYFDRSGLEWQVRSSVRQMVTFAQGDLRRPPTHPHKFDLLLCRNVLIYFDHDTKQKILKNLCSSLSAHGLLVLGCAETLINSSVPLRRTILSQAAFYTR